MNGEECKLTEGIYKKEIGLKFDDDKPLVGTMLNVFPNAFLELGAVIKKGQEKYPNPNNWKHVEGALTRYQDSLMRHLIYHNKGIEYDAESTKLHLAHVAWNALAILELTIMKKEG